MPYLKHLMGREEVAARLYRWAAGQDGEKNRDIAELYYAPLILRACGNRAELIFLSTMIYAPFRRAKWAAWMVPHIQAWQICLYLAGKETERRAAADDFLGELTPADYENYKRSALYTGEREEQGGRHEARA